MEYFLELFFGGLTRGSIYALIALGYTMVYGIIELINFAHGEIYMIGAFTALIVANLGLIFTNRSWSEASWRKRLFHNPSLWWVTLGSAGFLALVLMVPGLRTLFHFSKLHGGDIALCLLAGTASVAWFEILKWRKSHP